MKTTLTIRATALSLFGFMMLAQALVAAETTAKTAETTAQQQAVAQPAVKEEAKPAAQKTEAVVSKK